MLERNESANSAIALTINAILQREQLPEHQIDLRVTREIVLETKPVPVKGHPATIASIVFSNLGMKLQQDSGGFYFVIQGISFYWIADPSIHKFSPETGKPLLVIDTQDS